MREARQIREDIIEFRCFPMRAQNDQRIHEALLFKMLKELKMAMAQYGATTPFYLGNYRDSC
jgi:hypothetical protein